MKKSEIRKLVEEYKKIKRKTKNIQNQRMTEKIKEIEHRYFHETGRTIQSDFEEIT